MTFSRLLRSVKNTYNLIGWKTERKIVVIEIDDYGSERIPNANVLKKLIDNGYNVEDCWMTMNDCLESNSDLESLFDILLSFHDYKEQNPKITALFNVANPNYDRIKQADFCDYYYDTLDKTLQKYPEHGAVLKLYRQGINKGIFVPQFHGREHLNVNKWLTHLKSDLSITRFAFENSFFGLSKSYASEVGENGYRAAFDFEKYDEMVELEKVIVDGLSIFEKLFEYSAGYFIAPNGLLNLQLLKVLKENSVNTIGIQKYQKEPIGKGKHKKRLHYLGQFSNYEQVFLTRNCIFEPSSNKNIDWVDKCICEISTAFKWHKPAIIASHRANYSGTLNISNRDCGLLNLSNLLKQIVKKWPDVEFMTSVELGDLIRKEKFCT